MIARISAVLSQYSTPEWVDALGDVAVVLGFILTAAGVYAIIAKVVRWLDRKRDDRLAEQVRDIVAPIIEQATKPIQPGYRNGGHSLADVAEMSKANAIELQNLAAMGVQRDARIERIATTVETIDARQERMERRQAEQEAREERIEKAARDMAEAKTREHAEMRAETARVWDAVQALTARTEEA